MYFSPEYLTLEYPINKLYTKYKISIDENNKLVCDFTTRFTYGTFTTIRITNEDTCNTIKQYISAQHNIPISNIKLIDINGTEFNDDTIMFDSNLPVTFFIKSENAPYPKTFKDFPKQAKELIKEIYDFHTKYVYYDFSYSKGDKYGPDVVYHYILKSQIGTNILNNYIKIYFGDPLWSYCSDDVTDIKDIMDYITKILHI
jgi:hypothetical protein